MALRSLILTVTRCLRANARGATLSQEFISRVASPIHPPPPVGYSPHRAPTPLPRLFRRSLATEVSPVSAGLVRTLPPEPPKPQPKFYTPPTGSTVLVTVYKFPSLEPLQFETYPAAFLQAKLRRDILHRAIIFEADSGRLGLARTKTRSEIHGSGRKIRPQKGSGRARLGDRSSPMLRGGAKAHGPRVRDFSTKLPRKIYDFAFRIAFSYRYRRGDLIIVDDISHHTFPDAYYVKDLINQNEWGRKNENTLFVSMNPNKGLQEALVKMETEGRALSVRDVDCKNLLEMGRIVIEKEAFEYFLDEKCPPEVRRLMHSGGAEV